MSALVLEQRIAAARDAVWTAITEHYPQWIAAVCGDGARTDGKWEKDEEMEFHAPGGKGGVVARIVVCDKPNNIKWENIALIQNGGRAEFSAATEMFRDMGEQYALTDAGDGNTLLTATLRPPDAMRKFTEQKWPAALLKIKEIAEQA